MIVSKILSEVAIAAAKGASKVVLTKLFHSVKSETKDGKGKSKSAIVPYRSEGNKNIICFIHGFCGDPESTFSPLPDFIVKEEELNGWDIISIGYASNLMPNIGKGIWSADPDINQVTRYLETNLNIIFDNYDRVALIGHSMGGLVIQRALLNMTDIHKVTHVLFYGTPSAGLRKAWFVRWFKNTVSDMDYHGEFIKNLRKEWNNKFAEEYPFRFATIAGESDEFVPVVSSLEPFPEKYRSYTSGNHVTMVKPGIENDTSFQILKSVLEFKGKDYLKGHDMKALNNLVGKYYEDVVKLGSKINQLDKKGFRDYIFALEGIGKIDVAIKTIEESEIIKTNTDFMGILGGRWKRKYLIEGDITYLNAAISWYEKALQQSTVDRNCGQIYYHAINLAFLYLMQDETNPTETRRLAQLALDHCEKCAENNYWEFATKTEAYLYLNKFEQCKENYKIAIEKCEHDIRAVSSMMINAMYACNALNQLGWKHELEDIFLN